MHTIRYADGSEAKIVRYIVGHDPSTGIDFGLRKRAAMNFAKGECEFRSVYALGEDGEPYGIWHAGYGTISKRIDP
jgi:hypothetical protein